MQRKPGYPVANCNIKMPDSIPISEAVPCDDEGDQQQRRQQLINFGHTQWGFNNWSWSVNKQDLDFVDFANGKYSAGVVAFVSVTVKTFDIHRENIGYATCVAGQKGSAIYQARKCAVTNALRETLLSFGGNVATELQEHLESHRPEPVPPQPEPQPENNQNLANKPAEPKNSTLPKNIRKDSLEMAPINPANIRHPLVPPVMKNAVVQNPLPVAKALPMPANLPPNLPPAANRAPVSAPRPPPAPHTRPNSNEVLDEEARAERKRRQRQAQEEFRLKQLMKQKHEEQHQTSLDSLLMAIPTQDIVIEDSCASKRKSPPPDAPAKRRLGVSRLDIVESE